MDRAATCRVAFDTGPTSRTITTPLPPWDISGRLELQCILSVTKADTDAGDTLDVRVQFLLADGLTWNTVARFPAILGSDTPSATAPETRVLTVSNIPLETTDVAYEPDGSAGGTVITADSVRNGPFPRKYRTSDGWQPSIRLQFAVTDADADGDFEGQVLLMAA